MKGWTEVDKEKPKAFDLCMLQLADGRLLNGWWTGSSWDGPRYDREKVIYWKKVERR